MGKFSNHFDTEKKFGYREYNLEILLTLFRISIDSAELEKQYHFSFLRVQKHEQLRNFTILSSFNL
jgi:hypothetical protein